MHGKGRLGAGSVVTLDLDGGYKRASLAASH